MPRSDPLNLVERSTDHSSRPWSRWIAIAAIVVIVLSLVAGAWRFYSTDSPQRAYRSIQATGARMQQFSWGTAGPNPVLAMLHQMSGGSGSKGATNVDLTALDIDDDWLRMHPELGQLPGLFIQAPSAGITDEGLKLLAGYDEVTAARVKRSQRLARALKLLAGYDEVTALSLHGARVTDAGVQHLADHPNLTHLFLSETLITDASVDVFSELRLAQLSVEKTKFSDAGLARLAELYAADSGRAQPMMHLGLANSRVTVEGLRHLPTFDGLSSLTLDASQVESPGWESFSALPKLNQVMLDDIKDEQFAALLPISQVTALNLSGRGITDASIPVIMTWPKLQDVILIGTSVTATGEQQLVQSLKGGTVYRNDRTAAELRRDETDQ